MFAHLCLGYTYADSLEKQRLQRCIKAQRFENMLRHKEERQLTERQVLKTVGGVTKTYSCVPQYEVSLSCKGFANLVGYRSSSTGHRRKQKWIREGFISSTHRRIYLGHKSQEIVKEKLQQPNVHFFSTGKGYVFQVLADQIELCREIQSSTMSKSEDAYRTHYGL